jgi:plastocyanin
LVLAILSNDTNTGYLLAHTYPGASAIELGLSNEEIGEQFDQMVASFALFLTTAPSPIASPTTEPPAGVVANTTTPSSAGGQAQNGSRVRIVSGSTSLTGTEYQPNSVQASVGETITWTNYDLQPHTVTSGQNGTPDGKFDSSVMAPGATFEHTFTEAGEYPYFCQLHPNMVGTVSVS